MVKFYRMGNGGLIAEAGRGTTRNAIRGLQEREWAREQGNICEVVDYTENRAVFFALKGTERQGR